MLRSVYTWSILMSVSAPSSNRYDQLAWLTPANSTEKKGIESLTRDSAFNEIARFYYDSDQFAWVKENYSSDFGKYIHQQPRGVFKPDSADALQKFIQLANAHGVQISIRGQGHSHCGHALSENGIIVDLKDFPKEFKFPNPESKEALTVPANATVKEVLDFAFQHRKTLPVLTDYLGLSIGGLLGTGGLGGGSYKKGSFADHVLTLEVITLDGMCHRCSRTENPELFHATLCSLGQMGIILSATLSVVEKKDNVHCQKLFYKDRTQFLEDQHKLFSERKVDHLKGFITGTGEERHYIIEAVVLFDEKSDAIEKSI